jgi:hypothetical protein
MRKEYRTHIFIQKGRGIEKEVIIPSPEVLPVLIKLTCIVI